MEQNRLPGRAGHVNGQGKGKVGGEKRNAEKTFVPGGTAGLWPREEQY